MRIVVIVLKCFAEDALPLIVFWFGECFNVFGAPGRKEFVHDMMFGKKKGKLLLRTSTGEDAILFTLLRSDCPQGTRWGLHHGAECATPRNDIKRLCFLLHFLLCMLGDDLFRDFSRHLFLVIKFLLVNASALRH